MSLTITPQELHLLQDSPTIRTKCDYKYVTDQMVAQQVRRANLVAGDRVLVQCFDNEYAVLLAECEYRVTKRATNLKMVERPDFSTHQFDEVTFEIRQVVDWQFFDEAVEEGVEDDPVDDRPFMTIKWNVGQKHYDILTRKGKVVGCHVDKDTAQKMADGEIPLTEAA